MHLSSFTGGKRYIFHVSEVLKRLHLAALHSLIKTLSKCDIMCGKTLDTIKRFADEKHKMQRPCMCDLKCSRATMLDLINLCVAQEETLTFSIKKKTFLVKCFSSLKVNDKYCTPEWHRA